MKFLATLGLFLAFVHLELSTTIATPVNSSLLGNGDFSSPSFLKNYNEISSELIPYWTDRTSKEITLVNANFFNENWPEKTQALKLTSQTQVYQQFNTEINSTYRLTLVCSFAYNSTDKTKPIPPFIGFKILINDQNIRQVIPSSENIVQIDLTFKGEHILNRLQLIGFTIDQKNCDLNDFVLIDNFSIVEIMDAKIVKGYEQIYTLALGSANVLYTSGFINPTQPLINYWLDFTFGNYQGKFCFAHSDYGNNFFQVTTNQKSKWKAIIIQGGSDQEMWVTTFRLFYSNNGKDFFSVQGGKIYNANWDKNTKVRIDFPEIIEAYSIKMVPLTYKTRACFRIQVLALRQIQ